MAPQQPTAGLVSSYTLSEARMANDAIRASAPSQPAQGDRVPFESFEALLRELVDEQTYPRLHRIAWSAVTSAQPVEASERDEFLFGVDRILDGVQALIDAEPGGRQPGGRS